MSYDLKDASLRKRLKNKPKRHPYSLVPFHIAQAADFLYEKIAARPKRPRPNGGFRPKSERKA